MFGYIYKITNNLNQKVYIGKHKYDKPELDKYYITSGKYITDSINKYGIENFTREIIDTAETEAELNLREKYHIKKCNSKVPNGYNLTDGADGLSNPSSAVRKVMSVKAKERKYSKETLQKRSASLKKVIHTEEWLNKISTSLKGRKPSENTINASSKRHKGAVWYNNGVIEVMLQEPPKDTSFVKGRLKNPFPDRTGKKQSKEVLEEISKTKSQQRWYNNGIEERMFNTSSVPIGYTLGRLNYKRK